MHELGVVFKIIDSLKEVAETNDVSRISKVTLELGEVSTVIPDYLTECWEWAREKHSLLKDTELQIDMLPAFSYCQDCRKEFGTVENGKTCPHCGSEDTFLLRGNEFIIKEIEVPGNSAENGSDEEFENEQ